MKHKLLFLTLVFGLAGCAGLSVKQDYDTSVDFRAMKTYAWQPHVNKEAGSVSADNSLLSERVGNAVDAALSRKGYGKKASGGADFLVDYNYSVAKEIEPDNGVSTSVGFGSSFSGGFGMFGLGLGRGDRKAEIEKLVIDIINPVTAKLMWRGFVEQELVRRTDPDKATRDIRVSVEAILSKFPPNRNRKD